jgi:glycosyltransferase involved in cell wall biosynthesis
LQVTLDSPLPATLTIGGGTALFVCGTCFDERRQITGLKFVLDGRPQPVMAHGMPRLDYFRVLHPSIDPFRSAGIVHDPDSEEDPELHSYRSGFWGLLRIAASPPAGELDLQLRAEFGSEAEQAVPLGRISVAQLPGPAELAAPAELATPPAPGPRVVICLATYNPPPDLFRGQVESIRAQTHANWVCVISDDCSRPGSYRAIEEVVGGDPRFLLSRSPTRLGFYRNFERALALAPADAPFVALSDQDDRWNPEKLETLLGSIGDHQLVYSDARIVDGRGSVIAPTYWSVRRNNHQDLLPLLMANSVTGAASLFRRRVLEHALPFPPAQFAHFHDHWIALVALVLGGIEFVPEPLYDYVQHGHAALGHAQANQVFSLRQRLGRLRIDPRERVRVYRSRYFVDLIRLMAFATILDMRCGAEMPAAQRRQLRQFLGLERSWPGLARLGAQAGRELVGRPETLGAEWALLQSLIWRRLLSVSATPRPRRRLRLDAVPPANLAPRPSQREAPDDERARILWEKVAPLELAASDEAPRRVNILIPTFDLRHLFGGYIAKFNLARALARRGARVRLVTVDPVGPLPASWRAQVEAFSGLSGLFDDVEVAFGREGGPLEVNRSDGFIASTWWTAHVAHAARLELGDGGFVYLIQEYEPMTFPMGSFAALAEQSYRFPHFALFSSSTLRDYFRRHQIGAYGPGLPTDDERAAVFENAISPIAPPDVGDLRARRIRRVLFYARPEPHAARNMFELGLLALQRAVAEGAFREGWELRGIGSVEGRRRIRLGAGAELELLPRVGQADYVRTLAEHDVGLALMYTPHPSLVPIEMASAGLLTVTNTFENKTADALAAISSNLIAAEPSVEGVVEALQQAAASVEDSERRVRGGAVNWCRRWEDAFGSAVLDQIDRYLAS